MGFMFLLKNTCAKGDIAAKMVVGIALIGRGRFKIQDIFGL
jgi:hypothetical protein